MPASASVYRPAPGWRTLRAMALPAWLAACSPASFAAEVLLISDSRHPLKTQGGERLIALDQAERIEAALSADLPADPAQAAAIVRQRLEQGGADLGQRLASAHQDVLDAWRLGIVRIPAVVVERRYVVYGEPDVARALARIEQHRRNAP